MSQPTPAPEPDDILPETCDECESTGYNCRLHESWAEADEAGHSLQEAKMSKSQDNRIAQLVKEDKRPTEARRQAWNEAKAKAEQEHLEAGWREQGGRRAGWGLLR